MDWKKAGLATLLAAGSIMAGPVSYYGELMASGTKLIGSKTKTAVQVRGVSLGWSNTDWKSDKFFNANAVNHMVDDWKAEVIRVPLGTAESGGYGSSPAANLARVTTAIDAAIAKDVYVIIDWHSHQAENELTSAKDFFALMAEKYGKNDHVIFEVYNEPKASSWAAVKSYTESVIATIRTYSDNLVLVGSPNYDQNLADAAADLVKDDNVAYTLHFYAQAHQWATYASNNKTIGQNVTAMLNAGKPIFVSEYGTTHNDGGDNGAGHYATHDAAATNTWHSWMDNNKISSCAWNLTDKYEGSAFFGTINGGTFDQTVAANWSETAKMTTSGSYIYTKLNGYVTSAAWRSAPSSSSTASSSSAGSSSSVAGSSSSSVVITDGTNTIIDDFTDGNNAANTSSKDYWYAYTDKADTGASTITNALDSLGNYVVVYSDNGNMVAGIKSFSLVKGKNPYDPYVAIGVDMKSNSTAYNLSQCKSGFSYRYKGAAHGFQAAMSTVKDYNYHTYTASTSADWTPVSVPFTSLVQADWGTTSPKVTFDASKITKFAWQVKLEPTSGSLMIDDFKCLGTTALISSSSSSSSTGSSSSSSGTSTSSSSGAPTIANGVMIDDFADSNNVTYIGKTDYWYAYTDVDDKGASTISNAKDTAGEYIAIMNDGSGNMVAGIPSFTLDKGAFAYDPYVAVGVDVKGNGTTYDLSKCKSGFSYRYKGAAHGFQASMSTVKDYNYHTYAAAGSDSWTPVTVTFAQLKQGDWGTTSPTVTFDASKVAKFAWQVKGTPTSGSLMVDDFACLGTTSLVSSSSSGTGTSSSSGSTTTTGALIDDFSDSNNVATTGDYWYAYTDKDDKGASTITNEVNADGEYVVVVDDGSGNMVAGIPSFTLDKGSFAYDPYVAIGVDMLKNGKSYSLAKCTKGFSYRYKGAAHGFQAAMSTVKDYNYHTAAAAGSDSWATVTVPFTSLKQGDWGTTSPTVTFDASKITKFSWQVKGTPTSGSLMVDDFKCLGTTSMAVTTTPVLATVAQSLKLSAARQGLNIANLGSASVKVEIFDMQGKPVQAMQSFANGNHYMDLSTLSRGMYLVRAHSASQQQSLRLVIQ